MKQGKAEQIHMDESLTKEWRAVDESLTKEWRAIDELLTKKWREENV